jgi:primosomal protein N' (replication factor Y)
MFSLAKSKCKVARMGKDSLDLFGGPKRLRAVPVMVPLPVPKPYSYLVPEGVHVEEGSIVQVPLGPRQVFGVVWKDEHADKVDPAKLKPITIVFDCPPLKGDMQAFLEWIAAYTLSPPGLVARMALRAPTAFEPEPMVEGLRLTDARPERMTPARSRVISLAADAPAWTRIGLAHAAGVSASVIDGLAAHGVFEQTFLAPPPVTAAPDPEYAQPDLEPAQQEAADALISAVRAGKFDVTLIDGVTGSGKTEVYFEAIAETLRQGKQVLILLPEIALTPAFLERFQDRFGAKPAEWHSDLSPRMREKVWRQVTEGHVHVVAGARSALFLPFENLGLIIVDEEHDPAYKQEDRVFYNARDMAVVRGRIGDFPVVLVSATPSVESRVNADQGRYNKVHLASRFGGAALPDLHLVDMRRFPPARGGFLSPVLTREIGRTVERGEQALMFLNRRGYAPLTLCRVCGHRFQCPNCAAWLVEHRFRGILQCHHCGHAEKSHRRRGRKDLPRQADHRAVLRSRRWREALAAGARSHCQGRGRYRHRHAVGRQGAQFPQHDAGRHCRCRSRAGQW